MKDKEPKYPGAKKTNISSELKKAALKARLKKRQEAKTEVWQGNTSTTISAESKKPSTALTSKSDPAMQGEWDYSKSEKENLEERMKTDKGVQKMEKSVDLLKSKLKKYKKSK